MHHPKQTPVFKNDCMMSIAQHSAEEVRERSEAARTNGSGLASNPSLEVDCKILCATITKVRLFLQAFKADHFKFRIHLRVQKPWPYRILFKHQQKSIHGRSRSKGRPSSKCFVKDDPEAVNIARRANNPPTAADLFRGHVGWGAKNCTRLCQWVVIGKVDSFGKAEVSNQRMVFAIDDNIGRF